MANPVRGEVPLVLSDGRHFTLVMDMEALVEAETAYGKPLAKVMEDAGAGFVGASRALLFGALRTKHPDISLRDASGIFVADGDAVAVALTEATEKGFPDVKKGAEDQKTGNVPTPGKTSGGSGVKRGSNRKPSGA